MVVGNGGIKLCGRMKEICAKLSAEGLINTGVTLSEFIKRQRVARLVMVERKQFGKEVKGISKSVVAKMLANEREIAALVDRIFSGVGEREHETIDKAIYDIQRENMEVVKGVTVGRTTHTKSYNETIVTAITNKFYSLPDDKIYSVLRILTEEEFV